MTSGKDEESPVSGESGQQIPLELLPLHSTNLLTVLDENGVIQYESPSIKRLYGFTQDELVGEQVAEYFHPDDREAVVEAFQSVVSSEEYTDEAVEYRHKKADERTAGSNPLPPRIQRPRDIT